MANKNLSLTKRWMDEVWNSSKEDAIDQIMDANVIVHGIDGVNEPGPAAFKIFHRSFREQFPKIHVTVDDVVSEGEYETARCTVDGTTASGQPVHFTGMTYSRIVNGKIVESWNSFDFKKMYEQLGFKMTLAEEISS